MIDINYKVIIETGESGIDANVILCIYGDRDTTKNFALRITKDGTQAQFDKHSRLEFDLKGIDVGNVNYFLIILHIKIRFSFN